MVPFPPANLSATNLTHKSARHVGNKTFCRRHVSILDSLELRMTEVVVTTGAINTCKAPVKSSPPTNQLPTFLWAGCPSCRPTDSVKTLKGRICRCRFVADKSAGRNGARRSRVSSTGQVTFLSPTKKVSEHWRRSQCNTTEIPLPSVGQQVELAVGIARLTVVTCRKLHCADNGHHELVQRRVVKQFHLQTDSSICKCRGQILGLGGMTPENM